MTKNSFEWALKMIKKGYKLKRQVIKNDTVIILYKERLYQMARNTGVRYPYVPTNADLLAADWECIKNDD